MLQGAQAQQPCQRQICSSSNGAAHLLEEWDYTVQDAWLALSQHGRCASHASSALQNGMVPFACYLCSDQSQPLSGP